MTGYLFDTHVWIWLSRQASEEVSKGFFGEVEKWHRDGVAYLSPISCWEIGLLLEMEQLVLDLPIEHMWERDTDQSGLQVAPLTAEILIESTRLPGELHRDPADRILIATARKYGLTLVTRDGRILTYAKAGHVKARKP